MYQMKVLSPIAGASAMDSAYTSMNATSQKTVFLIGLTWSRSGRYQPRFKMR